MATAAFAQGGLSYFQKTLTYTDGKFTDVASSEWYSVNVKAAYEYGLMNGVSSNSFEAASNVKLCEVVALAARLRSIYLTGSTNFATTTPWYQTYVDYAVANEIIASGKYKDYNAYATRYQFAEILAAALPSAALAEINSINIGDIPDVTLDGSYLGIYKLYSAGILTGETAAGNFNPSKNIIRGEVAAIVTRMANEDLRVKFTIQKAGTSAGAQLLTTVGAARDEVQLALKYYNEAYSDVSSSNFVGAAASMNKAISCAQVAAQYMKSATDTCKANSIYSGSYDAIFGSYQKCLTAISAISQIVSASYSLAADWNSSRALFSDCSTAMQSAYITIRDLG